MDGKIGITHKRKFMIVSQNSSILLALCLLLTGCATTDNYPVYVKAQKSLSRDATVAEAARIAALTEMVKSSDNEVKIQRKYVVSNCDKCNMTIQVEHWDLAHRNYCIPCGLTKLGELDGLHS